MKKRVLSFLTFILITVFLLLPGKALAQAYSFKLDKETVNVFWNEDGTESLDYVFVFTNDPSGHAIEYVDLGLPNPNFDVNSISADVNGNSVTDISKSGYEGEGSGVAVGLGKYTIPPGQTGTVHIFVGTVRDVLYPDSQDSNYASAVFAPVTFPGTVHGSTDLTVVFHLPPGVKPEEPRWHSAPTGFPAQPATGFDSQGRITYTWNNPQARGDTTYLFGASFPKSYVPDSAIVRPNPFEGVLKFFGGLIASLPTLACLGFFVLIIYSLFRSNSQRKLQYLPPKIAIEGHGIKRGLTAIEAAILMEQPMDKILTMILFAAIKKEAATVTSRDPLKLKVASPLPPSLHDYEAAFVNAFEKEDPAARRKALQEMMVDMVKSVSKKMKGFSRRETIAYYRDIIKKAWAQVEAADTPEVKSAKYDEVMEWTMLDKNYEDRTRDVFRTGPVFVPIWWGRFDPGFGRSTASSIPAGAGSRSGPSGPVSLPHLPGSDFAASVVNGVQSFSSSVIGSVTSFTSGITQVTNPPPPPSSRGGGGFRGGGGSGCACACACACAGCACACAGGGR